MTILRKKRDAVPHLVEFATIRSGSEVIEGWENFLHEGEALLHTGIAAYTKKRKAFSPEALYNIAVMAIEKLVMTALMQRGVLPANHAIGDLVEALDGLFSDRMDGLRDDLLSLDHYQQLCDMETFFIRPPAREEIPAVLALAEKMKEFVYLTTGEHRNDA